LTFYLFYTLIQRILDEKLKFNFLLHLNFLFGTFLVHKSHTVGIQ